MTENCDHTPIHMAALPIHMAGLVNQYGGVSARCAEHRAINLRVASWTIRPDAVTCKRCIKIAAAKEE